MKKLIIDREKWKRGTEGSTYLLHPENKSMCCLGFDALNEGFTEKQISGKTNPEDIEVKILGLTRMLDGKFCDTLMAGKLIRANDSLLISDEKREAKITKLFAKIGREVEFIN